MCCGAKNLIIMQLPDQLLKRSKEAHKGSYGYVLVVGGSVGLTGAVCFCAQSALRAGAGLVKVAVPQSLNSIIESKLTEVMSLPLDEIEGCLAARGFGKIKKSLDKVNLLVVGPGAGLHSSTQKLIIKIIKKIDKPLVLDADAINTLAINLKVLDKRKNKDITLTPHLGEFSRLIKTEVSQIVENRKELAKKFALRYNLNLVLKGHNTLVTDGKEIFENNTGNPGLATAGTGDVLGGLIAGLAAQGIDSFLAAKIGVYLHGLAGDLAAKEKTQNCLIASDLLSYLPQAIKSSC